MTNEELVALAQKYGCNNRPALAVKQHCGCYFCRSMFESDEIIGWIEDPDSPDDRLGTAVCPDCGIDAVIGESCGEKITPELLKKLWRAIFAV